MQSARRSHFPRQHRSGVGTCHLKVTGEVRHKADDRLVLTSRRQTLPRSLCAVRRLCTPRLFVDWQRLRSLSAAQLPTAEQRHR